MSINTMSHEQATGIQAVERYVLGELTSEEREAFEGHYFDCPACFERVKLEMEFLRHARQVLGPEPEAERGWVARMLGDLRRPAPAFATGLLLCAIGTGLYQQGQIAELKEPRLEPRYTGLGPQRGSSKPVKTKRNAWMVLDVEVGKEGFASYEAEIKSESGKVKPLGSLSAGNIDAGKLAVSVIAGTLEAGRNSITVHGVNADGSRKDAGQVDFELELVN